MIPFRAAMVQGIANSLKQITIANGFTVDLCDFTNTTSGEIVSRVRIGESVISYDAPCPLITINESLENDDSDLLDNATGTIGRQTLRLFIQGDIEPAQTEFTSLPAYLMMADVRQRLAAEMCRTSPTDGDSMDPLGMGPSSVLATTGNSLERIWMSRGIVRGPEAAGTDGLSPKAHFWMRLALQFMENSGNPYSLTNVNG